MGIIVGESETLIRGAVEQKLEFRLVLMVDPRVAGNV